MFGISYIKVWVTLAALVLLSPALLPSAEPIRGVLYSADGNSTEFADIVSLIFSLPDGAESIPQNVNEWPRVYDPTSVSRSVPLSWVKSIEVLRHETKEGYRCLFKPVLSIETVSGVKIESELKTLEWVRIRMDSGEDRTVYFASNAGIQLKRIVLRHR
jgi:hypothetical protein